MQYFTGEFVDIKIQEEGLSFEMLRVNDVEEDGHKQMIVEDLKRRILKKVFYI